MPNARTLGNNDILIPGDVSVVESDSHSTIYIPANMCKGDQYRLLNTSDHEVTVRVENDAYKLEMVDADPTDFVTVPAGTLFYSVAGWSIVHNQFQVFATLADANSSGGGGGEDGDWLPVENPTYTGELTGDTASFGVNPVLRGTLAVADLDEMALITKGQLWDVLNGTRKLNELPNPVQDTTEITRPLSVPADTFTLVDPAEGEPQSFTFQLFLHPDRQMTLDTASESDLYVVGGGNALPVASAQFTGYGIVTITRVEMQGGGGYVWYAHQSATL